MFNKNYSGVTIIELILSISIFLILGTLSTAFYSRFINQNSISNVQDSIVSQLRKAQIYSMAGKQNNTWGVYYASNNLVLFNGTSYLTRNSAFDEIVVVNSAVNVSGLSEVVFARATGVPNNTVSIVITSNSQSKSISVNSLGVVSK